MSVPKAHIKLQTWEWIPDQRVEACHVTVYDPETIMPVYNGMTSLEGYLEFDIEPGLYVIWVYGRNPIGYRPFITDTWIPIAVLPGETKEVCAALISIKDITVLYNAVRNYQRWEPETFAQLLGKYAEEVTTLCNETAIQQREALIKELGDLKVGVIKRIEEPVDVRAELLEHRREWAEKVEKVAKKVSPETVEKAKDAGNKAIKSMEKRMKKMYKEQK